MELFTATPADTVGAASAVLLTAVVVFPSICRPEATAFDSAWLADAVAAPATREAVLTDAADEARNALLTEGVFNEAAEVKWVVLTAPSLIWAEAELLIAPRIRQIAMTLLVLHFIHPDLNVKKNLIRFSYIHLPGVLLPPGAKKSPS